MAEKPRQVVPDLGNLPDLRPQARGVDSYARPGQTEYGKPAATNSLLQLSHALAQLDPRLQQITQVVAKDYSEAEYAKGEADYYANRDVWNQHIKDGTIPEGVSPYFAKAAQRASLKELGSEFQTAMRSAYFGDAGFAARSSDDPKELTTLMAKVRQDFIDTNLKNGDKSRFTPLDIHEVFNPIADHAYKLTQQTHAAYRVQQREQEAEATTGRFVTNMLDGITLKANNYATDKDRKEVLDGLGKGINNFLYDFKDGLVPNGMNPTKANQIVIESVVAKAMQTGNRDLLDVLDHIPTKGGILGKTKDAIKGRTAAEEHITNRAIQTEHFDDWKNNAWFRNLQQSHTVESYKRDDERYARDVQEWQHKEGERAKDNIVKTYENRIFDGLRREDGQGVIDQAMKELELMDTGAALRMKSAIHTITKQKSDYEDNTFVMSNLRSDILSDPLNFSTHRLVDAVREKQIKPSTFLQMMDDLSRERQHGDDPLLRQSSFIEMLDLTKKGAMKGTEGTPASIERAPIAATAVGMLRDEAIAWRQEHPQGSLQQFNRDMREKMPKILEASDPDFKKEQDKSREKQKTNEQVKKAEEMQKQLNEQDKAAEQAAKEQKKPATQPAPEKPKEFPKPSDKATKALTDDPSQENIAAFTKKFGADALPTEMLPNSRLEKKNATTSGRFFVDNGEVVDLKAGTIVSAAQFNKRATKQEKDEVERLLRESGLLAE